MADEIVKEEAGKIQSVYGTTVSNMGITYKIDGRKGDITLLSGTNSADTITGTAGDDIVTLNGTSNRSFGKLEMVSGGRGRDTVILPGNQADWLAKLPNVSDYPKRESQDFWKDSPQQAYGRVVVLENVSDGTRVVLRDVESVVFADKKLKSDIGLNPDIQQPELFPVGVRELDAAIKSGQVKSVGTSELLKLAEKSESDAEVLSARIQSTLKAQEKLKLGNGSNPDFDKIGDQIAKDLMKGSGAAEFIDKVKKAPVQEPLAMGPDVSVYAASGGPSTTFKPV